MRRKRFLSLLLTAALVMTLLPAAPAQEASDPPNFIFDVSEGDITIKKGEGASVLQVVYGSGQASVLITQEITITSSTKTSHRVSVERVGTAENPIKIILKDVSIERSSGCAFDIWTGAKVHLTLADVNSLTSGESCAGLQVPSGATLTIGGTGELTATGGTNGAGIGGGAGQGGGDITISGGTVTANGGNSGAGYGGAAIGGGQNGNGGTITISGGEVTANGGYEAAGIGGGGGFTGYGNGNGGNITISGGTVTANGGAWGAGIGGGCNGNGGNIIISGGEVIANGGEQGAGIGGGANTDLISGDGGTITISSGEVTATGGGGAAGIGGGVYGNGGNIIISGGTVTANGGLSGAGIGGGGSGNGGTITISGGTVTANGGKYIEGFSWYGAGIGGGKSGNGGTVYISGGSIKAVAGGGSAQAIGHGHEGTDSGTLKNKVGGSNIYLTTVTLENVNAKTKVTDLRALLNGSIYEYGMKDVYTDDDGKLYLYLPENTLTTGAVAETVYYSGVIKTKNDSSAEGVLYLNAPPVVVSVDPSGSGAAVSGNLTIIFNKDMNPGVGTVKLNDILLVGGSWQNDWTYTIPYSDLNNNTLYTVHISGFQDVLGDPMADESHSFKTIALSDATLSGLTIDPGILNPAFAGNITDYTASVENSVNSITLTASLNEPHASMTLKKDGGAEVPWDGGGSVQSLSVGANVFTVTVTAQDGTTTNTYTITVTRAASSSGGGGGSSSSSSGERSSTQPDYRADVSGGGTLPVTINSSARNASVNINEQLGSSIMNGSHEIITMPSIAGISSYTLGIPVAYLTTPGGGTLTFRTGAGSITLPADMMAGIPGAEGKKAAITIGVGDKSSLLREIRDAIGDRPLIELSLTLDGEPASWNNPDAPVTISIPYEPTAEELAHPESIVIWYIDGNGNVVCIPNGHYDPDTGTVTFTTTHFSRYAVAYNPINFSDVPEGAWYAGAVSFIAARDITRGTGDGRFNPAAKLTRAEFIVLLMKAYGIAPDTNPNDNFSDAGNTWYTNYLAAAKRLGITSRIGNNQYAPGKEITRQEMFTLLCNTLKVIGQLPPGNSGRTLADISDAGEIAPWAKDSLALLVETGIVGGSDGRLNPAGLTTRAEMAQVLYNLLGKLDI